MRAPDHLVASARPPAPQLSVIAFECSMCVASAMPPVNQLSFLGNVEIHSSCYVGATLIRCTGLALIVADVPVASVIGVWPWPGWGRRNIDLGHQGNAHRCVPTAIGSTTSVTSVAAPVILSTHPISLLWSTHPTPRATKPSPSLHQIARWWASYLFVMHELRYETYSRTSIASSSASSRRGSSITSGMVAKRRWSQC